MTRDDIIRMAREAGFPFNKYGLLQGDDDNEIDADSMFERFAALVAAAEREACAKVCEDDFGNGALNLAAAIRARGQDPMPLFDDWPQFACPPCNHNCNQGRDCPNA